MDEGGLDEEIEVLEAIYIDELNISRNEDSDFTQIMLQLHPATGDDLDQRYVCMTLVLNIPSKYPSELPDFVIRNPRGIAEEEIASLREDMHTLCEDKRGSPMLYELIELAKDSLTAGNIPHCPCMICLEHFNEGEKFTKTECYHYFHEGCLSRYVSHILTRTPDILPSHTMPTQPQSKLVCPVCREPINVKIEELSTTHDEEDFTFIPSEELREVQKKLSAVLEHQKACGGIIDIEAEKNKYLVTNQDRIVLNLPQPKTDTNIHKTRHKSGDRRSEDDDYGPQEKLAAEERNNSKNDCDKGLDKRNLTSDKRTQSGCSKRNERYRKGSGKGNRDFDIKADDYERDMKFSPRSTGKKFLDKDKTSQGKIRKKYEGKKVTNDVANESTECDKFIEVTDEFNGKLNISVNAVKKDNKDSTVQKSEIKANENQQENETAETKPNLSRSRGSGRPRQNQSRGGKYSDKRDFRNKRGFDSPRDSNQSEDREYKERGARNRGGFGRPDKSNSYINKRNDFQRRSEEQERNDSDWFGARGNKSQNSDYSKYTDRQDSSSKHKGGLGTPSNAKTPISDEKEDESLNENNFSKYTYNPNRDNDGRGYRRHRAGFGRPYKDKKNDRKENDADGEKNEQQADFTKPIKDGFGDAKTDDVNQGESRVKSRFADKQNADRKCDSKKSDSPRDTERFSASHRKYGPRKYHGRSDNHKTSGNKLKVDYNDSETNRNEASNREETLKKCSASENISEYIKDTKSNCNGLPDEVNESIDKAINNIDKTKPRAPPGFKLAPPPGFQ